MVIPEYRPVQVDTQSPLQYFNTMRTWMDQARRNRKEDEKDALMRPVVEAENALRIRKAGAAVTELDREVQWRNENQDILDTETEVRRRQAALQAEQLAYQNRIITEAQTLDGLQRNLELAQTAERLTATAQAMRYRQQLTNELPGIRDEYVEILNTPIDAPNRYQALSSFTAKLSRYADASPEIRVMMQQVGTELQLMEHIRQKQWDWENTPVKAGDQAMGIEDAREAADLWESVDNRVPDQQDLRRSIKEHEAELAKGDRRKGIWGDRRETIIESQQAELKALYEDTAATYRTLLQSGHATKAQVAEDLYQKWIAKVFTEDEANYIAKMLGITAGGGQ